MIYGIAEHPSIRRASEVVVICLAAVTLLLAGGPSWAGTIRCAAQDPCTGTNEHDRMIGTTGSDVILALVGTDSLFGKEGHDELRGGRGVDSVRGGPGNDVVGIGPRRYLNYPADYREFLDGGLGHDVMYGNDGFSAFSGGGGNDTMYGRAGRDEYWYESPDWGHDVIVDRPDPTDNMLQLPNFLDDLIINLNSRADRHEMRTANGGATTDWDNDAINFIHLGRGDDIIRGNEHDNIVWVLGNDTIYGRDGGDDLRTSDSSSNVTIYGGQGNDFISAKDAVYPYDGGPDTVDCGPGDADTVHFDVNDTVENCEILNP